MTLDNIAQPAAPIVSQSLHTAEHAAQEEISVLSCHLAAKLVEESKRFGLAEPATGGCRQIGQFFQEESLNQIPLSHTIGGMRHGVADDASSTTRAGRSSDVSHGPPTPRRPSSRPAGGLGAAAHTERTDSLPAPLA